MLIQNQQERGNIELNDDTRDGIEKLKVWGKCLSDLGLAPGSSGNMSFQTQNGFIITRTGAALANLKNNDFVEVTDVEQNSGGPSGILRTSGTSGTSGLAVVVFHGKHCPSKDAFVHSIIYRHNNYAKAIFHFHDDLLLKMEKILAIPSTEKRHVAGTVESIREIEKFIQVYPIISYFILKEHGIMAVGYNIEQVGEIVRGYHYEARGRR